MIAESDKDYELLYKLTNSIADNKLNFDCEEIMHLTAKIENGIKTAKIVFYSEVE